MNLTSLVGSYIYIGGYTVPPSPATVEVSDDAYAADDILAGIINSAVTSGSISATSTPVGFPRGDEFTGESSGGGGLSEEEVQTLIDDSIGDLPTPAIALITDTTLGADTANFDFTSIPGTYKHLWLVGDLRSTEAAIQTLVGVRFNNDSGANYQSMFHYAIASADGQDATGTTTGTKALVAYTSGANASANHSGAFELLIPNYAGTTFHKAMRAQTAFTRDAGNDPAITDGSGIWMSASAVTRVTVFPNSGSWKAASRLSLYGIS